MLNIPIELDVRLGETNIILADIASSLRSIVTLLTPRLFEITLTLEDLMPVYVDNTPNFDFRVVIAGTDEEGNVNPDSPVPVGMTLSVTSDNPDAFSVVQDALDPRLVHAVVGSSTNPDGSFPAQANVVANLTLDSDGSLVATGGDLVTVVANTATTVTSITLNLPPSNQPV